MKPLLCLSVVLGVGLAPARAESGYPRTLAQLIAGNENIFVLEVEKVDRPNGPIHFKKTADLKGRFQQETVVFGDLRPDDTGIFTSAALRWARPGRLAIVFADRRVGESLLVHVDNTWCVAHRHKQGDWWFWKEPPEKMRTYVGSSANLRKHIEAIRAGKEVVITAAPPDRRTEAYGPSPIPRDWVRGKKGPVWRIKAGPSVEVSPAWDRSQYFVGWGVGGAEAIPGLVKALAATDARDRAEAAEDLGRMGSTAKPTIPDLHKALNDADAHVRVFAAEALLHLDPKGEKARPVLTAAMKAAAVDVRRAAVAAAGELGLPAAPLAADLAHLLSHDPDELVRSGAAFALKEILRDTGAPADLVRIVMPALTHATRPVVEGEVRYQAVRALLKCGPEARHVRPALTMALRDDRTSSVLAADLLTRLGPGSATALAHGAIDPYSPSSRRTAIDALGTLGPEAKAAVPELLGILKDDDSDLRLAAAIALLRVDPVRAERAAVPVLIELLGDENNVAKRFDQVVLRCPQIGPAGRRLVPLLAGALRQKHAQQAAMLLGRIGPAARVAVPNLERRLEEAEDDDVAIIERSLRLIDRRPVLDWINALQKLHAASAVFPSMPALLRSEQPRDAVRAALALHEMRVDRAALATLLDSHPETILELSPTTALSAEAAREVASRTTPWLLRACRDEDRARSDRALGWLRRFDPAVAARVWETGESREETLPWARLAAPQLEQLWKDLGSNDEARSQRALWYLALNGKPAADFLKTQLAPVPHEIPDDILRLVKELDDDQFAVREKAGAALLKRGDLAQRALKRALVGNPSLELRRRAERILQQLSTENPPESPRNSRAIEALQNSEAAEAKAVLQGIARGAPEAALTQAAATALRPPPPPFEPAIAPLPPRPGGALNGADFAGVVMLDGKPLAEVEVTFIPVRNPRAKGSRALTDKDGTFELLELKPGPYKVVVKGNGVPARYSDPQQTPLKTTLRRGDNIDQFTLEKRADKP